MSEIQVRELMDYINGEWVKPTVDMGAWVYDPNTGEKLQPQLATSDENLEQALATAHRLHTEGDWRRTSLEDRAALLEKTAGILQGMVPEIAMVESATTGIVISTSQFVNAICWLAFGAAAEQLRDGWMKNNLPGPHGDVEVLREPWGVAALIVPWNAPAALAAHKVANALAAGAPCILKPSEWAPYSCLYLVDALEQAGLPKGLFQIVNGGGEVGNKLVSDKRIRAVSFTGGLGGGRAVAHACAEDFKSLQLELGGNNAMVILDDADLDKAADGVVQGMTTLNGQWCRALGRLLVHESVADSLTAKVEERLAELKMGVATDESSQIGPLVHGGHRDFVASALEKLAEKGGNIINPTSVPEGNGYFFPPTLVTGVAPEETLDEIFGPVATLHTFSEDTEAIAMANQTPFGLGGYVFGRDEERALGVARQIETGGVKVNGVSLIGLHPMAPRPAWGLSGYGVEGTKETLEVFLGTRVVGVADR